MIYIKHLKILFLISIMLIFTACSRNQETIESIPIVVAETSPPISAAPATETPLTEPTPTEKAAPPPQYNEYNVDLELDPVTRMVRGVQKVKFTNRSENTIKNIYFHLYLNAFIRNSSDKPFFDSFEDKIYANGRDYGYIDITNLTINKDDAKYSINSTLMNISLDEPLEPNAQIEMTLSFDAYVPKINHRTGANNYAMWCGNFLPILAVYDADGWHTDKYYPAGDPFFSEISNYTVNITTPSEYTVVGTGLEKTTIKDNKKITSLNASMVRDFAFTVSQQYKMESVTTNSGIDVNIYYYSELTDIYYYLEECKNVLEYFTKSIGAYPYDSIDIVESGLFMECGMEYPQIVFMDSVYLAKKSSYKTLIHELAHQWFYNCLGNNQVMEAWLDEGLSSFIQDAYIYSSNFDKHMEAAYDSLNKRNDSLAQKTLDSSIREYSTWNNYYNIQYVKGKLMFYSLKLKMGTEKFDEFLKSYYNKYSFQIVDKNCLIQTAESIYGDSLTDFFDSWLYSVTLPPMYTD